MARVIIQIGHCWRRTGATGTDGEQVLNSSVGGLAAAKLRAFGHSTRVILADEVYSGGADVFIAHHADGSTSATASGASVGYPDKAGGVLAHEFKVAYAARGWPYGFRADNYTAGLRGYYAYSRHTHIPRRIVVEAGFMTNPTKDRPWIDSHHGSIAQAIVDAVNELYGTPVTPEPVKPPKPEPVEEDEMRFMIGISHEVAGIPFKVQSAGAPHWYALHANGTMTHIPNLGMRDDMRARGWENLGEGKGADWCVTYEPVNGPVTPAAEPVTAEPPPAP